jgi:hypothetical protein
MIHARSVLAALVLIAASSGCKSAAQKCMETTDETYQREVLTCKDEECKKKALKNKLDYYEICKTK